MPLRIGCDLDGVLADMESALVREAEVLFGPLKGTTQAPPSPASPPMNDVAPEEIVDTAVLQNELQLTPRQRQTLWRHVRGIENFWESLEETEPGVIARLATLANERRWEILFLTRRPETAGATQQVQSQRWLEAKGFHLPSVYVVTGSRGLIAAALSLDVVVDDTPENCVDIAADSKARVVAVLGNRETVPPPVFRRMGIQAARSADEWLNLLVELDGGSASARTRPGTIERFMRSLGLKEQTDS